MSFLTCIDHKRQSYYIHNVEFLKEVGLFKYKYLIQFDYFNIILKCAFPNFD